MKIGAPAQPFLSCDTIKWNKRDSGSSFFGLCEILGVCPVRLDVGGGDGGRQLRGSMRDILCVYSESHASAKNKRKRTKTVMGGN